MARSKDPPVPRLFLDSGVWLEGLLAPWSVPRAILIHARRKVFTLILAEYVRQPQIGCSLQIRGILPHG